MKTKQTTYRNRNLDSFSNRTYCNRKYIEKSLQKTSPRKTYIEQNNRTSYVEYEKVYRRTRKLRGSVHHSYRKQTTYRNQIEKVNKTIKTKFRNSCTKPRGLVRDEFLNKYEYKTHVI